MTLEIRPVTRDEAVAYLKVLPFANGLPSWEPYPAAWYGGEAALPPLRTPAPAGQLEKWADEIIADPVFHSQAAFADGRIVGGSAMLSLEITVPGWRAVPMGGVTSTAVVATHRRRGVLRGMMQAMFDEARGRGEAIATLSASEGGIYGRFGYGPATLRTRWEIERSAARLRPPAAPHTGSAELADAATARAAWPTLHEIARHRRVGEISPQADQWGSLTDSGDLPDGPLRYLIHRAPGGAIDGVARYRLPWSSTISETGVLIVEGLEAVTDDAYRGLWEPLLDFDLTRRVVAVTRPADEPLRWMLSDPRAMRITRQTLVALMGVGLLVGRWRAWRNTEEGERGRGGEGENAFVQVGEVSEPDEFYRQRRAGGDVSLRGLIGLGITGGALPCPSALVVMLSAIALHRIGFGLLLIVSFSLGLAVVLTALGLLMMRARNLLERFPTRGRLMAGVSVLSAGIVTIIGIALFVRALSGQF